MSDNAPLKVTFLNSTGTLHSILGFYTVENETVADTRLLFPHVHNDTLIAGISSVFIGTRLLGKAPLFFLIKDGFKENSLAPWFADAALNKNGVWRFLNPCDDKDATPALHLGQIKWQTSNGFVLATHAVSTTKNPVLVWCANDGAIHKLLGQININGTLTPEQDTGATLVSFENVTVRVQTGFQNTTLTPLPSFLTESKKDQLTPALPITTSFSNNFMYKTTTKEKTVFITGGAKRIGKEIALYLAQQGYHILIHCNTCVAEATRLVSDIQTHFGVKANYVRADFMDEDQTKKLLDQVCDKYGSIDALINNAGVFDQDTLQTCSTDTFMHNMTVNLTAPLWLSQAFARLLPENKTGNIINLIDQRVLNLTPAFTSYTLSKAGLWTLTQTLSLALAPKIRVNAIGVGDALPAIQQSITHFENRQKQTPLGIGTTPLEIAKTVSYILETPSLTGQIIALDGGQHLVKYKG